MIEKNTNKTEYADGMNLVNMRQTLKKMSTQSDKSLWSSFADRAGNAIDATTASFKEEPAVERRDFLKLMGASMSLAGLTACTKQPTEMIVPYVDQPEDLIPGKPLFFATLFPFAGFTSGILAESHMGRPTKVEGNDSHVSSRGSSSTFAQASVLDLYDPDRSRKVIKNGRSSTWSTFRNNAVAHLAALKASGGEGLSVVIESNSSITLAEQIKAFKALYPKAKLHFCDSVSRDAVNAGTKLAFGEVLHPVYQFKEATTIVSLDADFLGAGPNQMAYARDYADNRDLTAGNMDMNRLYAVEPAFTVTGAAADHRIPVKASRVEQIARAIADKVGIKTNVEGVELSENEAKFVAAAAADLKAAGKHGVVVPGDYQNPVVHAVAHAINEKLGALGATVTLVKPFQNTVENTAASLKELADDLGSEKVKALFMLGVNPVYDAPADLKFAELVRKAEFSTHLGAVVDETAELAHWHVPAAHYLETWSDGRSFDGTEGIAQPLIQPLYDGKSVHDLFAVLNEQADKKGHDIVQEVWKARKGEAGFDAFWKTALHDGVIKDSSAKAVTASVSLKALDAACGVGPEGELEIVIRPDAGVWDGRFANNVWLQELPNPVTTLTWDNVLMMSVTTAVELEVMTGDEIAERYQVVPKNKVATFKVGDEFVTGPVMIVPGHADGTVSLSLGYGRTAAGQNGSDIGYAASAARTSSASWLTGGSAFSIVKREYALAMTQDHHSMEDRPMARSGTLEQYKHDKEFVKHQGHIFPDSYTLYKPEQHNKGQYQWGMTIDMNRCISCNSCVVACQSENNIPSVGKKEIFNGREMHWIRIDRYYEGEPTSDDVRVHTQPVACVQCENAPCETVCPVGATMHSNEGINQMVYNRCVGTRYCANNCPYKVRRFNYFQYTNLEENSLVLGQNPNVTIRTRGVMEKCTYCIQRINTVRITSKKENRTINDGEVVTACQQACPTRAIAFGDISDEDSRVSHLRKEALSFRLLAELNTQPRTSHLGRVRNPNLDLEPYVPAATGHHGGGHGEGHGDDHAEEHAEAGHGHAEHKESSHDGDHH